MNSEAIKSPKNAEKEITPQESNSTSTEIKSIKSEEHSEGQITDIMRELIKQTRINWKNGAFRVHLRRFMKSASQLRAALENEVYHVNRKRRHSGDYVMEKVTMSFVDLSTNDWNRLTEFHNMLVILLALGSKVNGMKVTYLQTASVLLNKQRLSLGGKCSYITAAIRDKIYPMVVHTMMSTSVGDRMSTPAACDSTPLPQVERARPIVIVRNNVPQEVLRRSPGVFACGPVSLQLNQRTRTVMRVIGNQTNMQNPVDIKTNKLTESVSASIADRFAVNVCRESFSDIPDADRKCGVVADDMVPVRKRVRFADE